MREVLHGNEPAIGLLDRALAAGRLPHAVLLHGPEGLGKATVAVRIARALLCSDRPEGEAEPCGGCSDCRASGSGNHPDLFRIGRLPKRESRTGDDDADGEDTPSGSRAARGDLRPFLTVDQIRDLSEHAAFAPRQGRARVFVIDPADRMNVSAQNALLKTLEEPPSRAFLLLVAARPHLLLPTVRSRCLAVGFSAMDPEELAEALHDGGMSRDEARSRASLAGGRPGAARILDVEATEARRDDILSMVERTAAAPAALADIAAMAKSMVGDGEEAFLEALDLVETILRDAARSAAGAGALMHADRGARIEAIGRRLGALRAAELLGGVERVRANLRFHLNRTLAAEALLTSLAGGPAPLGTRSLPGA